MLLNAIDTSSFDSIKRELFSDHLIYSAITEGTEATLLTYQKIIANATTLTDCSEGTETTLTTFEKIQDTFTEESEETELPQYKTIKSSNVVRISRTA